MILKLAILVSYLFAISCGNKAQNTHSTFPSIYSNIDLGDTEWFLRTKDSVELYILEYGKGIDTIIVLHGGFGAEHRYLKDAFEGLYDKYHFIFYDQRGSLRSPCSLKKVSMQNHISDIEAIRKEFKMDKINLFGHSNGTTLATHYLRKHPENVRGFIMTACMQMQWPHPKSDTILSKIEKEIYVDFENFLKRPEVENEIEKIKKDSSLPPSKRYTQIQTIKRSNYYIYDITLWNKGKESYGSFMNYKAGNATINSIKEDERNYDNTSLYQNHSYPITIIMGEYDMIDPGGKKFKHWTKDLSNVNHVLVKNASHDIWIDRPKEFKDEFQKAMSLYNSNL